MAYKQVVTRFPPSPTGNLHVGSARTALFNWLFTRKMGGKIILRFEDTDIARSKREYEKNIIEDLRWLGLEFSEGAETPIRQSERSHIYKKYIEKLLEDGRAYISKEQSREGTNIEIDAVRLKNKGSKIEFEDIIRGKISFDTSELGDFVIAKSKERALYHLAVVVDDFKMGVTHVIRGEDLLSSTARQILIGEAIGASRPVYAHIPIILATDRSKLSKRHGAASISEYRKLGYLPGALFNHLALLGWNPGDDREIFTREELIELFDLEKVQKSGAIFNIEKLDWINREHIKLLSSEEFMGEAERYLTDGVKNLRGFSKDRFSSIEQILRERISKFSDVEKMSREGELLYFFGDPDYGAKDLFWKGDSDSERLVEILSRLMEMLEKLDGDRFNAKDIKGVIWGYATEEGRGFVLWPMRYALTGRNKSPDPFEVAGIIGKEATLKRLRIAIKKVNIERISKN